MRKPDNKNDKNAIRVEIEVQQVGHIGRDDAEDMQGFMKTLERQGRPAWVRATLNGGSDGRYIGVELDRLPDY